MPVRAARPGDAPAIAAIVAHEIRSGYAHFGEVAPPADEVARDIGGAGVHPYVVFEEGARVVGYARSSRWKAREGYDWTAEIGVYVAPGFQGRGVGRALVTAVVDGLQRSGFRALVAGIALPNAGSVALFESLGFTRCGTLPAIGYKQGAWRDVGLWMRLLADGAPGPAPVGGRPLDVPIVQVDAFASQAFDGNPAAVVLLPEWLPDSLMLRIAAENNLSETAFVVEDGTATHLRWFTPTVEVALCGHATLAAGAVVLGARGTDSVVFHTLSGPLSVSRADAGFALELPVIPPRPTVLPDGVVAALGTAPLDGCAIRSLHHADYWLARFDTAERVRGLRPDVAALRGLRSNVICTAPGDGDVDFVSRFFAPASGVDEDPVTGSAHASLTPYWVERLGRNPLRARQIGPRGGALTCTLDGDRVILGGRCVEVIRGALHLPDGAWGAVAIDGGGR